MNVVCFRHGVPKAQNTVTTGVPFKRSNERHRNIRDVRGFSKHTEMPHNKHKRVTEQDTRSMAFPRATRAESAVLRFGLPIGWARDLGAVAPRAMLELLHGGARCT